jgi:hypothetical protein
MKLTIGRPVLDLVSLAYKANRPVMLRGAHGLGKSEIMKQTAKHLGVACVVIDLSLCEPMDLVGLPVVDRGRTRFASPSQLPINGKGLLVIEELNRAAAYVRRPCLQLLTERALNEYRLPDGWLPVACVNPPLQDEEPSSTGYDVDVLDPALESRFIVVDVEPGLKEWLAWAGKRRVHEAVVGFVRASGVAALTDPIAQPRAWHYISEIVRAYEANSIRSEQILWAAVEGCVGPRWAAAFLRTYLGGALPLTAEQILDGDPVRATVRQWHKGKRVDLFARSLRNLQEHLSTTVVAREVVHDDAKRKALESFVKILPSDVRVNATQWLAALLGDFGVPKPRRGARA